MSVRKITLKGKTQTVKRWSIELNIPTKTIYNRISLGWPPELILSKKYFSYCTPLEAAGLEEKRDGYPTSTYRSGVNFCCTYSGICQHAIPLTAWEEVSNDPSEAHFYCQMLNQFVWGEDPKC